MNPNDKYSDLINKALDDLPFKGDSASAENENPIIFKDISVVLTKIDDDVKPTKSKLNANINEKDWKAIHVNGVGTAYCCVKCDRCFNVQSSMISHICSKSKSNRNVNRSNKISHFVNSEAKLDSDLLLPIKSNNTTFINQYLLKMPDNSYVLLRIIDTDVNFCSQSYDINDVKNELKNIHVTKNEEEENSLKLPEKSKNPKKIGPLSFLRNTRNRNARSQNNTKLNVNSTEETLKVYNSFENCGVLPKQSSSSIEEPLFSQPSKSKSSHPTKPRGKNGRFLKENGRRPRSRAVVADVSDIKKDNEASDSGSIEAYDNSQNPFDALSENNLGDSEKFVLNKHYKVSHNQSGKIVLSNVNSKDSRAKLKKAKIESPPHTEVQSPSIIEALKNKEFFTFVNVDPILQRTSDSSMLNDLEIEESPCTSIDEIHDDWRPSSRKRRSVDSKNYKPTELDVCYICNKHFTSMSQLAEHLEDCFDKNINK